MQPLIRRYIALVKAAELSGAGTEFARNFVAYLKKRGHSSLLPQIVARYARTVDKKQNVVTLAKEGDAEKFAQSIAGALTSLNVKDGEYEVRIDERAVGGYSVRARGKVVDRTYRSALVQLYQNITQ